MAKNDAHCSFCGADRKNVTLLIAGATGHICEACALQAVNIVNEEQKLKTSLNPNTSLAPKVLKPTEIKKGLDEYIIGQDAAKKVLAVAVYNHYKRRTLYWLVVLAPVKPYWLKQSLKCWMSLFALRMRRC